jgi:hypothetical protein
VVKAVHKGLQFFARHRTQLFAPLPEEKPSSTPAPATDYNGGNAT